MKKTNRRKKALVLSMAMAAMLAMPTTTFAQQRENMGGLFGTYSESVGRESKAMLNQQGNRDAAAINDGGISNYGIGENAPLGGGLVILLGAGLGYVALKKKEDEQ